jgi:hypothetical protein
VEQLELLKHAVATLEALGVPYVVVGSWGSGIYGEPRFTRDIDIVLDLQQSAIEAFCSAFPDSDYYLSADSVRDAIARRFQFNVLHPATGNKIDFIMTGAGAWSAGQLKRARTVVVGTAEAAFSANIAAPEDVIIGKLWYYSAGGGDRHLRDIAGILRVTGAGVDRAEVERWARELGYLEIWEAIVAKVDAPDPPPGPGVP